MQAAAGGGLTKLPDVDARQIVARRPFPRKVGAEAVADLRLLTTARQLLYN